MWPEIHHILKEDQIQNYNNVFLNELSLFIEQEKLDESFKESFKSVYLPLAKWIENKHTTTPVVIGLNGGQGSGKSTLSKLLVLILETLFSKTVLHLSIDDLYISRYRRLLLADEVHPLLSVRGVPGTHDVNLGIEILKTLKTNINNKLKIPRFDKALDDLLPDEEWTVIRKMPDIIIFEGWCVGAKPQSDSELLKPLNKLEESKDTQGNWRHYVNRQLTEQYNDLFSYIDHLIMLKVPDMESVFEWRCLQESKLNHRENTTSHIKSEIEVKEFVMYFERITMQCLKEMPQRADVVLNLNKQHQISKVIVK
ncbi:MAG: hypothetical protein DIZ80_17105 [endosymbiont of Galathealinum brachiosum]|uniref:KAP NTPase domain-containing protein n=1 Tax=endosymbiont of Galathealinum brachiosum TaxID=2200906 RepID=A0A370D6W1_9GAMM|nr:MAG: hypothetical protein DIZ80_17105 [endosymbiont of Galathealinum brachiosum]